MSTFASDLLDGKDDFCIYAEGCVDILSKASSEADLDRLRPIGGVCSTERLDRQDEVVLARGLDFEEFVKHGYFNDNHKQDTAAILGVPKLAELRKGRWHTEGNLLVGYDPADRVWALAKSLQKSGHGRKLGFSIEGKVLDRGADNRITRAKIRHVAITNSPVNVDCTWGILAKSFGSVKEVEATNLRRAISAGASRPLSNGGGALMTSSDDESESRVERDVKALTFDETVKAVKSIRPGYSWANCERLARIIYKQEERR